MALLTWILVGLLLYTVLALYLQRRGLLPDAIQLHGPLVTVHTGRGRAMLDRIAGPRRFWRAWGNFGLGIALVVMLGSVLFLGAVAVLTVLNPPPETAVNQPRNVLVIPGVNDFLPLSVAPEIIAGLVIGVVIHEAGHGILCRVEDIEVKSLGLVFITVIFAGAFVEPDEASQRRASRGARSRMFAAGVTNNFALTAVAFLLLFGPVVGSLSVVGGATVAEAFPGSPAAAADIGRGDVITGVGDTDIESNGDLDRLLANTSAESVEVHLRDRGSATITRSILVTGAPQDGWPLNITPSSADPNRSTIVSVNGTTVSTTAGLRSAVSERPIARLATADGAAHTGPIGALVLVSPDQPLNAAGAPTDPIVITRFAGQRVVTGDDLLREIGRTTPGQTVTVHAHTRDGPAVYEVTMGEAPDDDDGFLGVFVNPGFSGLEVTDLGIRPYPAGRYLSVLGGSCPQCPTLDIGPMQRVILAVQLPLAGITGGEILPYNFAGFADGVERFYTANGPLGGWTFLVANILFWTAWINLNLAFFNCIPTFLLDGGHMLRAAIEAVVAHLPGEHGAGIVAGATVFVQLLMLASLALMLFGAQLLG